MQLMPVAAIVIFYSSFVFSCTPVSMVLRRLQCHEGDCGAVNGCMCHRCCPRSSGVGRLEEHVAGERPPFFLSFISCS